MFKDREFTFRMERADKVRNSDESGGKDLFEDRLALVHSVVKDLMKTVFVGICAYVVLDTVRQRQISRNTKF